MSEDVEQSWRHRLRDAMVEANIPTLLMVLVHLSGDDKWLNAPYTPSYAQGLDENDSGGLPIDIQDEIRAATFEAVSAWKSSGSVAVTIPPEHVLLHMMSAAVGEHVSNEYADMMSEELGFLDRDAVWADGTPGADFDTLDVVVIGAGLSGICAAIKLEQAGVPYTVIEKNPSVGGTWFENIYPGAGVDTPSHLYSYAFNFNQPWTRYYATRDEIEEYLERCTTDFGIRERIRFHTEVLSADYNEQSCRWDLVLRDSAGHTTQTSARVVISAVGQLNRPKVPDFEGLDLFAGLKVHSAQWSADIDLRGKRVALIGTGASAFQIGPKVVDEVESLTIFQRSPAWTAPNDNYLRIVGDSPQFLLAEVPFYAPWYRFRLLWMFNDKIHATLQIDPDWPHPERSVNAANDGHRHYFTKHIIRELASHPDLVAKVLPDYPPFGKRILMDSGWFKTLTRDNVTLVTDVLSRIGESWIETDQGDKFEVDVIVFATGFHSRRLLWPMELRGRGGADVREVWGEDDARAYLGITIPEFPNLFMLYGPNTNLGHGGSIVFHTECQVRYIMGLLHLMRDQDIASVECKVDVHDEYNSRLDAAHEQMIWTHPGMETWYRNAKGRVVTNSPWRLVDYWRMTRTPSLADYTVVHDDAAARRQPADRN